MTTDVTSLFGAKVFEQKQTEVTERKVRSEMLLAGSSRSVPSLPPVIAGPFGDATADECSWTRISSFDPQLSTNNQRCFCCRQQSMHAVFT